MNLRVNIRILLAVCLIANSFIAFAQLGSKSPYTKIGYGDMVFRGFAEQLAQGGITSTFNHDRGYSIENPASLAALRFTLFSFGIWGYNATLQDKKNSQRQEDFGYGYFGVAVPLMANSRKKDRGCGLAFGLTPFTSSGYESIKSLTTDNGGLPFFNFAQGLGGMSRLYASTGFNISKNLSFGGGISYIFGVTEAVQTVYFPDSLNLLSSQQKFSSFQNGFVYDLGLQHRTYLKRDTQRVTSNLVQTIGISAMLSTKVNTITDFLSTVDGVRLNLEDTLVFRTGAKGSYHIPAIYRIGYSLERLRKWQMNAEFQMASFNNQAPSGMGDYSTMRIGFNFCPNYNTTKKFFKTNVYRMGFFTGTAPFIIGGQQVPEWAVTAGISIPVTVPFTGNQVKSGIHFSMEYHERGAVNENLIKEQFWRFTLGFTLADRWFIKPKID